VTIYLKAPDDYKPGGPDGQGWNRLSLNAHMGRPHDRCALRPRTYAALVESQDTRRAQWGACFDICTNGGSCVDCPLFSAPSTRVPWDGVGGRVLVRIQERGDRPDRLHVMQDAEAGWDSRSLVLTWEAVARLDGWSIGRQMRDEVSAGFWLLREGAQ